MSHRALLALLFAGACADPVMLAPDGGMAPTRMPAQWQEYGDFADAVFEGVVVDVAYRESTPTDDVRVPLPHAFVTYEVTHGFKGVDPGEHVTLRFVGGPALEGERHLRVSHVPDFDLGEHDILFVVDNGARGCPLVGDERGRLRVAEGGIYDNDGMALDVRQDEVRALVRVDVPDVTHHEALHLQSERFRDEAALPIDQSPAMRLQTARDLLSLGFAAKPGRPDLRLDADVPFTHAL